MPSFDRTPDKPKSFGYKVSWFAVKASDSTRVLDALGAERGAPANWASGLAAALPFPASQGSDRWVFVSPPVSNWVLVVGSPAGLPHPVAPTERFHAR
jgi:hypothetical protein